MPSFITEYPWSFTATNLEFMPLWISIHFAIELSSGVGEASAQGNAQHQHRTLIFTALL